MEKDKVKQAADCCRKILNHVNQAVKESEDKQVWYSFQNLRPSSCNSETLFFRPFGLMLSPLSFSPATFFLLHILCPKPWLPFKQHSCFYPSVLLSVLLEIGGLSEKIGPVLLKADRQPNDPGVKGELTTQTFFLHLKPTCLYSYA